MRTVFGAHVLIFILFFIENEASGMSNIFTDKKSSEKEKNKLDALSTSRLTTPSASTYNPTSIEHEALDLHKYRSHLLDSSGNPISYLGQGNVEWSIQHLHNVDPSHSSSPSRIIQNDQIQHHEEEHPAQEASGKKVRSKKGKGKKPVPDLNVPIKGRKATRKKFQDLNLDPYHNFSPAMQEAYKSIHAPVGVGEPGEMKSYKDTTPLTEDKLIRERKSFQHFQSFYKQYSPPSSLPSAFHSGVLGAHEYAAPSVPPHSEGQFGSYGIYGYAAPSLQPNPDGHFGGSGTHGYTHASPPFFPHQWGNDGAPGTGNDH